MNSAPPVPPAGAGVRVRAATAADLPVLRDIERAAGTLFRTVGMDAVADDEPLPIEALERYRAAGRAFVAVRDPHRPPVGYLLADLIDGCVHIEQVSVHPDASRTGVGTALLEHVTAWAVARGAPALTLTTFRNVAWNAPYYLRRWGFRILDPTEVTPGLHRVREHEARAGMDRWPRVCMRRDLPPA